MRNVKTASLSSVNLPSVHHSSFRIQHSSLSSELLRHGLRKRAEQWDAEQAHAQSPQRRVRHDVPLAPYIGHDPAKVFGDGAPILLCVAWRACVLGDGLFVESDCLVERLFL